MLVAFGFTQLFLDTWVIARVLGENQVIFHEQELSDLDRKIFHNNFVISNSRFCLA